MAATELFIFIYPLFLPGESQGQRSLVGCRLWGRTESDTTEATAAAVAARHVKASLESRKKIITKWPLKSSLSSRKHDEQTSKK